MPNPPKPKKGDIIVKSPTAAALLPIKVRNKIERACKIKAQIDALNAELTAIKQDLIADFTEYGRTRESCMFGVVQFYPGKNSIEASDWAKSQIENFKAGLRESNPQEFRIKTGDPYLTVSATIAADTDIVS